MKKSTHEKTAELCRAAVIAAAYVVLSFATFGFSSGVIQLRLSEALCVLAVFTPAAIPGMTVGCLAFNLLSGCALYDVIFGTLATLIGAVGIRLLRKFPYVAPAPYVLSNALIIPAVLRLVYAAEGSYGFFVLTVGISELLSAWGLGLICYIFIRPYKEKLFQTEG